MFLFGILCEQKVKYKNERKMDRLWDIYSAEYYSGVKRNELFIAHNHLNEAPEKC